MGEFGIGQGVPRFEDPRLVRGGGRYVDDIVLSGMAFGVVLRSPHGHAKILSIDTAAAKTAPGVLAVLTAKDWKAAGLGDLPSHSGLKRRDGSPRTGCDGLATASLSWWRKPQHKRWMPRS
jgi:aerobic carbon-monoxide dehydrogenase large subunit